MAITFHLLQIATWYLACGFISLRCTLWCVTCQGQGHSSRSKVKLKFNRVRTELEKSWKMGSAWKSHGKRNFQYLSWKNHGISEKVLEINKKSPWILFSTNLYFSIHELSFIWKLKKKDETGNFPLVSPKWFTTCTPCDILPGAPGIRKSSALFPSYSVFIKAWKENRMSHSKGSCRFNSKWAACETYKDWLRPFKSDSRKALCILCDKLIDLSNMGESALRSHCKSSKHVGNVDRHKRNTGSVMTSFFQIQ